MEEEIDEETQLLTGVKKTDETNKELPPKDVPFMDRVRSLLQSSIYNKNIDSSKLVDMLTRKPSSLIKLENEGPSKNSKMLNEPEAKVERICENCSKSKMLNEPEAKVEQNREHSVKPIMLSNEPEAKVEHENREPSKNTKMLTSEPETTTEQENNEPSEDVKVLTTESETTTESDNDEPSEDTEMLSSEPETSMELESPEPSEDDDLERQDSGNSISDKIKGFFGWKKKYIQIKKVTTNYGIRVPPTMDKLGLDCEEYFIENFQYYEDLPYLEVRREENDENSNDNGEIEIENTVDGYAEDCTDFSGRSNEENTDSGESKDNPDKSKEKDEAKKDDSNKDEKILENPNGNSYKESNNSNMENGNASNSDKEVKGKSIIQIAKKVATTILKAITDTYI
ncbi:UNVERIFIED_CONTAM: hypothetical protein RMT77_016095 [Armadillidium vulgare]